MKMDENQVGQEPDKIKRLKRTIVILPDGLLQDINDTLIEVARHGKLSEGYSPRLGQIREREIKARHSLSDAFKRIGLFEVAGYIAGVYSTALGDSDLTSVTIPKLYAVQSLLMSQERDYSKTHNQLVDIFLALKKQKTAFIKACDDSMGTRLPYLSDVLEDCAPMVVQYRMNIALGKNKLRFSIIGGVRGNTVYQNMVESNPKFADFSKTYPSLLNPVIGHMILESPDDIDYASDFLDKFVNAHATIDPSEVRFRNGRSLEEQFEIEDRRSY